MDVRNWLDKLGLRKYAVVFSDNEVEFQHLQFLEEKHLEAMGLPTGPRVKLLSAISELRGPQESGDPGGAAEESQARSRPHAASTSVVDLKWRDGALLEVELIVKDPGQMPDAKARRELHRVFQDMATLLVEREDGEVLRYTEAGLVAHFPSTSDGDEVRALAMRTALDVSDSTATLPYRLSLDVNAGIHPATDAARAQAGGTVAPVAALGGSGIRLASSD